MGWQNKHSNNALFSEQQWSTSLISSLLTIFLFFFTFFFSKLCLWILSLELELNITRIISYLATLSRSRFILHIPQLESNHFTFMISFILFRKWDLVAFFLFLFFFLIVTKHNCKSIGTSSGVGIRSSHTHIIMRIGKLMAYYLKHNTLA